MGKQGTLWKIAKQTVVYEYVSCLLSVLKFSQVIACLAPLWALTWENMFYMCRAEKRSVEGNWWLVDSLYRQPKLVCVFQVKVNLQGDIIDRGCTNLGISQAGFTLHSAIYATRPDIRCIVHIHTPAGAAVGSLAFHIFPNTGTYIELSFLWM